MTGFKNDKLISNVSDGLKVESPGTPHFYMQPKIHREGNPGRPVIRSLNSHMSKISEYVQPIVTQTPLYVKDTNDFLCKLDTIKSAPDNASVSLDVIPNTEGIKAVKESFDKQTQQKCGNKSNNNTFGYYPNLNCVNVRLQALSSKAVP